MMGGHSAAPYQNLKTSLSVQNEPVDFIDPLHFEGHQLYQFAPT
jgi:hypothetical protein